MEKIILTDADGVLVNWDAHFTEWMRSHGFNLVEENRNHYDICKRYNIEKSRKDELVRAFNEGANIGFLPPHRDAIKYVRRLHEEEGYVFRVITSLSTSPWAKKLRERNLEALFGSAIEDVICLPTGGDKDEELAKYKHRDMAWIEDKPANAQLGYDLGLTTFLMLHDHNIDDDGPYYKVHDWKTIYDFLSTY